MFFNKTKMTVQHLKAENETLVREINTLNHKITLIEDKYHKMLNDYNALSKEFEQTKMTIDSLLKHLRGFLNQPSIVSGCIIWKE